MRKSELRLNVKGDLIYFGDSGINSLHQWKTSSSDIDNYWKSLQSNGLKFYFEKAKANGDVIIYLHLLEQLNWDISRLIREINKSQKGEYTEYRHSVSLTKLCYHYHHNNFSIEIPVVSKSSKNPDIIIESVRCDLKTRNDKTHNRLKYKPFEEIDEDLLAKDYFDAIRTPSEDFYQAYTSRSSEGFAQADTLIFDLSDHFHSWNYYRLEEIEQNDSGLISQEPLSPKEYRIIIYSPRNANQIEEGCFKPQAKWLGIKLE